MFALIDGNNFYASCERVFQPELRGKPLVVLSNNDGCAIARSDEAKAIGVQMGHPIHKIPTPVRRRLAMRSANFGLYGNIASRIGVILRQAVPRVEVYSIDESFLDLSGIAQRRPLACELRERVHRWTGIPNCIGIAPTKTLAKLGNHIAKKATRDPGSYPEALAGVCDLAALSPAALNDVLHATPVIEVWGGRQSLGHSIASKGHPNGGGPARCEHQRLADGLWRGHGANAARSPGARLPGFGGGGTRPQSNHGQPLVR